MDLLDLNTVAHTISGDASVEIEVDVKRLRSVVVKGRAYSGVIYGHLLPVVLRDGELSFVAVLRCEPMVLKRRLVARGYNRAKIVENLEAELIGVILDEAVRAFGEEKVHEYDTSKTPAAVIARKISDDYLSGSSKTGPWIDWTHGYDSTRLRSLLSPVSTEPAST